VIVWGVIVLSSGARYGSVDADKTSGVSDNAGGVTQIAECPDLAKLAAEAAGSTQASLATTADAPHKPLPSVAVPPRIAEKPMLAEVARASVRVGNSQAEHVVENAPAMDERHAKQWKQIERSGDSQITVEELAAQMVAPQFAGAIFKAWDKNKDGVVTREEFCRAEKFPMLKSSRSKVEPAQPLPAKALPAMNQEQALQWEQIERSGDSQITVEELAAQMVVPANAGAIFKAWDMNKDGVVNREEFMRVEMFPWLTPRR
jgi:Ca2+-binding EF-hand superfamily protein